MKPQDSSSIEGGGNTALGEHHFLRISESLAIALIRRRTTSSLPLPVPVSQHTITHGLLWVFAATVVLAIAQLLSATSMRRRTCTHPVRPSKAVESLAT